MKKRTKGRKQRLPNEETPEGATKKKRIRKIIEQESQGRASVKTASPEGKK